jgi:D-alanine-D-alanine ligase-like ATP-grasp enzyme
LRHFGYSVSDWCTFFSDEINRNVKRKRTIDDGWEYIQSVGLPVIVKPNNMSQGTLVAKIHNKRQYYSVARKIFRRTGVLLVERLAKGADYRVVILDGEVISAYQRVHLHVVGDGTSSVARLLVSKQQAFEASGRDTLIDATDFRIAAKMRAQGLTWDSVPTKDERVFLLDNANLSTGGDSIDVTATMHPTFKKLAADVTHDMNLRLCGVDLMTEDITRPVAEQGWPYTIIEVNGAPGIDNYAAGGEAQLQAVKDLYRKILLALQDSAR